jgi:ABC-type uncharacterized transport system involved in gliding motility auxiliary subunit
MAQQILGIVGWIGTALVFGAVAVRFIRPEWDQYAIYGAWAGLACVVLYTLGQWREIVNVFKRRQARYGALATVSVLVALGVVVAANYLSARENKRWDLTAAKQNSLSEQTVKVLKGLDAPIKFNVFDKQTELDRFRTRIDEYAYQSKNVSAEYIDPDKKPVVAKEYGVDAYGTVLVEYKGRREKASSDSEQDLTNAIIKAISGKQRNVYFVSGHGEKDPTRTERDGYSAVSETLKRDNYKVDKLVLAQVKDVPADATAVIVAGPTSDLLPQEVDALRRYLMNAGKLMVLIDPVLKAGAPPLTNLQALVKEWDIELGTNVVVDVSGATNEPSLAVAASYPAHPITDNFRTLTVYPLSRSVDIIQGGTSGRNAQPLVETSQRSWAEMNLESLDTGKGVEMDAAKGDKPGPVTLAAAVSVPAAAAPPATPPAGEKPDPDAPKPESRLVVFGDSDFPSNAYGGIAGNPDLFANAVNWLAQQENLIAIRPKAANDRRVTMTARQQQGIFLISILVVPAMVFGAGFYSWWRRR